MKDKPLILDDESLILTSLEHLFENDYEVFTTNNAETALGLAVEHDIAVILCDERMPVVSGHEFLGRVRQASKATRVMMSGYTDMHALTEAVNSGQIFAYIEKPWAPLELKAKVSAAVVHFKLVQEVDQERGLLRALMENIPDLIYFKDRQSRFTRVNEAHARNLGARNSAECIGKSNADYFPLDDAIRWRLQEQELMRSGHCMADRIEHLQNPCGELGWWSTTKVPMFDRSGQVSGIAGISRNITALKNSEEMLREQSERNRLILETANDAFIGMDADGSITTWNTQAELTFGWTAGEVKGRRWWSTVIAPAYREAHAHGVEHFLTTARESPVTRPIELMALHRDGHEFPVEATVWPVRARGACSFNAFIRDISERKKAEEALSNSEQKYRSILESAPDAIVVMNGNGEVVLVNSQAERMFGHPRESLLGQNIDLLFPEHYHHQDLEERGSYLPDPQTQIMTASAELKGLRSDGAEFPIEVNLSLLETREGVLIFNAIRDVTERKTSEQRSRQLEITTAEAEATSKAKSMLLSTMSHEIRTPLHAILGYSELMLRDPDSGVGAKVNLKIIHRSGEHLLKMINDILDMAKLEAGRTLLVAETFDLRRLLDDLHSMFRLPTQAKALEFEVQMSGEPSDYIVGDGRKIRQVLINLLGNAVKFTERGRIDLQVSLNRLSGNQLWLSAQVMDTGIGMTAEEQRTLYQPFVQGQAGQRVGRGGTGLGLAISLGSARLMGGDITLRSTLGKGSIFRLEIPVERGLGPNGGGHPGDHRRVVGIKPGQNAPRILIADDVERDRNSVGELLAAVGFFVRSAENGQAAVRIWEEWSPQLILMDVHMPVMDGIEAARNIKSRPAGVGTVIIALTGDVMNDHPTVVLENDLSDLIWKPYAENELLEKIRTHLGLDYVYDDEIDANDTLKAPALQPAGTDYAELKELPSDLILRLHHATFNGDKALLDELIPMIGERGDAQSARTLQELADTYQYDRLIELLEKACPQ